MKIRYKGTIINGCGKHSELGVPGRTTLREAPDDWPDVLAPGSLNVLVASSGYPYIYRQLDIPTLVSILDNGFFKPVFTIEHAKFVNNQIIPTAQNPQNGMGQVWRTTLLAESNDIECWMLRRIGSGLKNQIELVSHEDIRATYGLDKNRRWPVTVIVEGKQCAT